MTGSHVPFPWPTGQPLTLRASLYTKLRLPALVGAQIGIVSDQWRALRAGQDVTFPADQMRAMYPLGTEHPNLPADLSAAASWTLVGDNTLEPTP